MSSQYEKDSFASEVFVGIHSYPVVHGIRTHVIKYGQMEDDDDHVELEDTGNQNNATSSSSSDGKQRKKLVLVIPGNPGIIDFYQDFMKTLHQESGWPVWGLSHAGHSIIPPSIKWEKPHKSVFTLEGQIQHKVYFINECIPKDVDVVLIGHSIGAYVILNVMDRVDDEDKIIKGMLLFPTIERMAASPQGSRLTPILKYARWLLVFLCFCISMLPQLWQNKLVDWFLGKYKRIRRFPDCFTTGVTHVLSPFCTMNSLYMAHVEMKEVDKLNIELVKKLLPKLHFYYGATDHWCPVSYYKDMKEMFPHHDNIQLCEDGFRHAFIIDAGKPMGRKVAGWLQDLQ